MSRWHVCVLIPARNEEELLPRCLRSILHACKRLPSETTCDVVVAVDASTDATAAVATKFLQGRGEVITTEAGAVGVARAAAAKRALARYDGPLSSCWLAHTDADCIVPEDWLLQQLRLAQAGTEAVAGIVSIDSFREHKSGVEQRFHQTYLVQPDGCHTHVHGANLGVRADLYLRAGGWSKLETAEDHDLWRRIQAASTNSLSSSQLVVVTSGRRIGRAPHGFAAALAAHNEAVA